MKKAAIDLTWVRPNKVGGTESCVRNLLDGFTQIDTNGWELILLLTKDNAESFKKYRESECYTLDICDLNSANQRERVFWQNTKMGKHLKENGIKVCVEPVYGKPFFGTKGIEFITTIHDLQALHYPHYFSKARVAWMKLSWMNAVKTSNKIIAISNYVKGDIEKQYRLANGKVQVIYDAVDIDVNDIGGTELLETLGVEKQKYYYTVSSLFLHKNLKTIIIALAILKRKNSHAFYPLVVSGIGGRKKDELDRLIKENGVENYVIFTSFVNNTERNMLYQNCKAFLFPSIFEGFGMPPVEAMAFGAPVLTTEKTSIPEVTCGLCNYVENAMDPVEWAAKIEGNLNAVSDNDINALLKVYDKKTIAYQYIELLQEL